MPDIRCSVGSDGKVTPPLESRYGYRIYIQSQRQLLLRHALGFSPTGNGLAYGEGELVAHGKPNLIGELPNRND